MRLLRIETPYFVAGLEIQDGRCVRAAPIVKYMLGWKVTSILYLVAKKHQHRWSAAWV